MIADYQCEKCGLVLGTDQDDKIECPKCIQDMVLVYKKEWIGSIEHGHEEIYQKET